MGDVPDNEDRSMEDRLELAMEIAEKATTQYVELATESGLQGNYVKTWEILKRELKEQFLPNNTSWIAREDLKKLRQDGSVRDYVKKFSSLILDIDNMSEEDRTFNFLSGLQPWAQLELHRQKVSGLSSAISIAGGLADFGADASKGTAGASSDSYPPMDRYEMKKKKNGLGMGEPKQACRTSKNPRSTSAGESFLVVAALA